MSESEMSFGYEITTSVQGLRGKDAILLELSWGTGRGVAEVTMSSHSGERLRATLSFDDLQGLRDMAERAVAAVEWEIKNNGPFSD